MRISDVEDAFTRAERAARNRGLLKSLPTATEDSSHDEETSKPTLKQKVNAIMSRCNAHEQALLSNVVDPSKSHTRTNTRSTCYMFHELTSSISILRRRKG